MEKSMALFCLFAIGIGIAMVFEHGIGPLCVVVVSVACGVFFIAVMGKLLR